jgi:hypothetical protein
VRVLHNNGIKKIVIIADFGSHKRIIQNKFLKINSIVNVYCVYFCSDSFRIPVNVNVFRNRNEKISAIHTVLY